jgi:DNA adenine methylase
MDKLLDIFTHMGKDDEDAAEIKELDGVNRETYLRAPFGWPGGKYKELKFIIPHLPIRESYIEPFGGSGAVLLAKESSPLEVFNDRYAGVVAFYRCIRDSNKIKKLIDRLEWTIHSREEFLWCKETWNSDTQIDDIERAARWYYMITNSFSKIGKAFARVTHSTSIIGTNIRGHLKDFNQIHERMKRVQVENLDFRVCLKDFDFNGAVFYCDPPYLNSTDPYNNTMTENDHIELLDFIFKSKGFFALSGYPNDLYDKYKWDQIYTWDRFLAMRPNNVKQDRDENQRVTHKECLWIKDNQK